MNNIYSDAFMDMEELFTVTAPPSRTTFIADPVVIIKTKIRDDFIVPNAVDTQIRHPLLLYGQDVLSQSPLAIDILIGALH